MMDFPLPSKLTLRRTKGRNLMKRCLKDDVFSGSKIDIAYLLKEVSCGIHKLKSSSAKRQKTDYEKHEQNRRSARLIKRKSAVDSQDKATQTDFEKDVVLGEPQVNTGLFQDICATNAQSMAAVENETIESCDGQGRNGQVESRADIFSLDSDGNGKIESEADASNLQSTSHEFQERIAVHELVASTLQHSCLKENADNSLSHLSRRQIPLEGANDQPAETTPLRNLGFPSPLNKSSTVAAAQTDTSNKVFKSTKVNAILDHFFPKNEMSSSGVRLYNFNDTDGIRRASYPKYPENPNFPADNFEKFIAICRYIKSWADFERNQFFS